MSKARCLATTLVVHLDRVRTNRIRPTRPICFQHGAGSRLSARLANSTGASPHGDRCRGRCATIVNPAGKLAPMGQAFAHAGMQCVAPPTTKCWAAGIWEPSAAIWTRRKSVKAHIYNPVFPARRTVVLGDGHAAGRRRTAGQGLRRRWMSIHVMSCRARAGQARWRTRISS